MAESSPETEGKGSRPGLPAFQQEPDEDLDIDNYSDGGIADLNEEDQGRPNLLNFNQVEKDSSIQQIKTHEDDEKFLSSGSKGSVIEEVENAARSSEGASPPGGKSSRISRDEQLGLQAALAKDGAARVEEESGAMGSGMSPVSHAGPEPDAYPEDEIEEQASQSRS